MFINCNMMRHCEPKESEDMAHEVHLLYMSVKRGWLDSKQTVSFVNDLTNYKGAHLQLHKESDSPFEGEICVCQIMNRSLVLVADV